MKQTFDLHRMCLHLVLSLKEILWMRDQIKLKVTFENPNHDGDIH